MFDDIVPLKQFVEAPREIDLVEHDEVLLLNGVYGRMLPYVIDAAATAQKVRIGLSHPNERQRSRKARAHQTLAVAMWLTIQKYQDGTLPGPLRPFSTHALAIWEPMILAYGFRDARRHGSDRNGASDLEHAVTHADDHHAKMFDPRL